MKSLMAILVLLLVGCAMVNAPDREYIYYLPKKLPSESEASAVINQLLIEQPARLRLDRIEVTYDYFEYDLGVVTRKTTKVNEDEGLAVTRCSSKCRVVRNYYNSIGNISYWHEGSSYNVQLIDVNGAQSDTFTTLNQAAAERFIDGLNYYIQHGAS